MLGEHATNENEEKLVENNILSTSKMKTQKKSMFLNLLNTWKSLRTEQLLTHVFIIWYLHKF